MRNKQDECNWEGKQGNDGNHHPVELQMLDVNRLTIRQQYSFNRGGGGDGEVMMVVMNDYDDKHMLIF